MERYRLRPRIVQAVQWWPPGHPSHVKVDGVEKGPRSDQPYVFVDDDGCQPVNPGDWFVTNPDGDVEHWTADVFAREFVKAGSDEAPDLQTATMEELIEAVRSRSRSSMVVYERDTKADDECSVGVFWSGSSITALGLADYAHDRVKERIRSLREASADKQEDD